MLRALVVSYLILTTLFGSSVCCCAPSRLLEHLLPTSNHAHHGAPAAACCCCRPALPSDAGVRTVSDVDPKPSSCLCSAGFVASTVAAVAARTVGAAFDPGVAAATLAFASPPLIVAARTPLASGGSAVGGCPSAHAYRNAHHLLRC
jgi:hypothetical protein